MVVAGSAYGEMAMHFIEKYGMMALRLPSKFDMRRFCRYSAVFPLQMLLPSQVVLRLHRLTAICAYVSHRKVLLVSHSPVTHLAKPEQADAAIVE